jgi:hypothetical protein
MKQNTKKADFENIIGLDPSKIVPHFHIKTLLDRINRNLDIKAKESKQGWTNLIDWSNKTKEFVAYLPKDIKVKCGLTNKMVNPFKSCQDQFGSSEEKYIKDNSTVLKPIDDIDIYNKVKDMHFACLGLNPSEHLNLLEVLANCGIINKSYVKKFCNEILNQPNTPEELMEEFIDEMEGGNMLGENSKIELTNKTLYVNSDVPNHLSTDDVWIKANKIGAQGYHGQLSEFELFMSEDSKHVVIIQRRHMKSTSVTNLAEKLRDKIKDTFGDNTRVYEAYEEDAVDGNFIKADEIVGNKGEDAGWLQTSSTEIPQFSSFRL